MAYTASDAFCAATDVEGLVGRGAFTSSTVPTAQQVLDWMARVAAEVESKLFESSLNYTVSTHGTPFPATPTDPKVFLAKVLAESANALGAAAIVLEIHGVKDSDGKSYEGKVLRDQYNEVLAALGAEVDSFSAYANVSRTNTTDLAITTTTEF